jgi:hypothetical protein
MDKEFEYFVESATYAEIRELYNRLSFVNKPPLESFLSTLKEIIDEEQIRNTR